jgi:hypothetical protein
MTTRPLTVGERVRAAECLTEFRGATGTVVCLTDVAGDGRGDGCVTVEFDRPVAPFEDCMPWTHLNHAMRSFERIDDAPKRRRLTREQPPPPGCLTCEGPVAGRPLAGVVPDSGAQERQVSGERAGGQDSETDTRTCPICLETLAAREIVLSRCQPVPHAMHRRCWMRQKRDQQARCCVCRQLAVDDLTFIAVAMLCGVDHRRAAVGDLTAIAKSLLQNYQRGVVSRRELWSFLLWMRGDGDRPSDGVMQRIWQA